MLPYSRARKLAEQVAPTARPAGSAEGRSSRMPLPGSWWSSRASASCWAAASSREAEQLPGDEDVEPQEAEDREERDV